MVAVEFVVLVVVVVLVVLIVVLAFIRTLLFFLPICGGIARLRSIRASRAYLIGVVV